MKVYDNLGNFIADSDKNPLEGIICSKEDLEKSLDGYILSVSGWRAVFAPSKNEEDRTEDVSPADRILAATVARAFAMSFDKKDLSIVVARDARPTGRVLLDIVMRVFVAMGINVHFLFLASAPEVMCYLKDSTDGFFYISASHNPIAHNGFKFGSHGGVWNKERLDKVTDIFKNLVSSSSVVEDAVALVSSVDQKEYLKVLNSEKREKKLSVKAYNDFVLKTAKVKKDFQVPFGVVADFNGSARSTSEDMAFLSKMGAKVWSVNERPGQIEHAIVPEGKNLELCRKTLEKANKMDSSFILGYTPDNDGDRGNFVAIKKRGSAEALSAQDVFALITAIEMADQAIKKEKNPAIAVNGPTSYRVNEIAAKLGVKVFRSDVGESNVVTLADNLRASGYSVHVCGEGSNGGIITDPARVRDPMNSMMSIAKLYSIKGLYSLLMKALGSAEAKKVSLSCLIDAMPKYATTPAFSSDGVMRIASKDFDKIKLEYEALFMSEVNQVMEREGFSSYKAFQYDGSSENEGMGEEYRTLPSTGGYRIAFYSGDEFKASLWLSKSRTEPVMRVMADVKGDDWPLHDRLLSWQRSMVERADKAIM